MARSNNRKSSGIYTYWSKGMDDIITKYNMTHDEELFNKYIYHPFRNLAESVINAHDIKYYPDSFKNLISECVTFMHGKISHYKKERGASFAYFNYIVRNFLWQLNSREYRNLTRHTQIEYTHDGISEEVEENKLVEHPSEEDTIKSIDKEFITALYIYWITNYYLHFSNRYVDYSPYIKGFFNLLDYDMPCKMDRTKNDQNIRALSKDCILKAFDRSTKSKKHIVGLRYNKAFKTFKTVNNQLFKYYKSTGKIDFDNYMKTKWLK